MAIGRRSVLAGGAALWVGAPAILRAQTAAKTNVSHGFAMHGTPKYPADAGPLDYVNPDAPKGGSVKLGARGTFDAPSLHPQGRAGGRHRRDLRDAAAGRRATRPSTEYGLIAETIEWPDDRSWVAFTLRPEARWHDGTPITVEDVIFTFDILKTKGAPDYALYYADVAKAEKIGDRKVKFTFQRRHQPRAAADRRPAAGPAASTGGRARDFEKTTLEPPLGSGPYKVDAFEAGRSIAYRAGADDWWAKDLPVNGGRNNFDAMRYDYYRDDTVRSRPSRRASSTSARRTSRATGRPPTTSRRCATGRSSKARDPARACRPACRASSSTSRRDALQGPRACARRSATLSTSNGPTRTSSMASTRARSSYFGNSELAVDRPAERRTSSKILEPLRGKIPDEVFTKEYQAADDRRLRQHPRQSAQRRWRCSRRPAGRSRTAS